MASTPDSWTAVRADGVEILIEIGTPLFPSAEAEADYYAALAED